MPWPGADPEFWKGVGGLTAYEIGGPAPPARMSSYNLMIVIIKRIIIKKKTIKGLSWLTRN